MYVSSGKYAVRHIIYIYNATLGGRWTIRQGLLSTISKENAAGELMQILNTNKQVYSVINVFLFFKWICIYLIVTLQSFTAHSFQSQANNS